MAEFTSSIPIAKVVATDIDTYITQIKLSEIFDNYQVRVSIADPFLALSRHTPTTETAKLMNYFPSITIAAGGVREVTSSLGREHTHTQLTQEEAKQLLAGVNEGTTFASNEVITMLKDPGNHTIIKEYTPISTSIVADIWSFTVETTGILFDIISSYVLMSINYGRPTWEVVGGIQGQRSGDVMVDYGAPLYRASLDFSVTTRLIHYTILAKQTMKVVEGNIVYTNSTPT